MGGWGSKTLKTEVRQSSFSGIVELRSSSDFFFTDAQNPSVWSAERACPGASVKRMRQDPAGGPKDQKLFPAPVLNKGKMLFSAISPSSSLSLFFFSIWLPYAQHVKNAENIPRLSGDWYFFLISAVRSQHFAGGGEVIGLN